METLISISILQVGIGGLVIAIASVFFVWANNRFNKIESNQSRFDEELKEIKVELKEIKEEFKEIKGEFKEIKEALVKLTMNKQEPVP